MLRRLVQIVLVVVVSVVAAALVRAGQAAPAAKAAPAAQHHIALTTGDLKWGPAPPVLPAGAQVAVLDGDPFAPGFFAMRLKMPDRYKIPAHTHPTDENVIVIQGTLKIGVGDVYNEGAMRDLPAGGFVKLPKDMRHFAGARGETIVHLYGQGPVAFNYVNPADDPSRKIGAK